MAKHFHIQKQSRRYDRATKTLGPSQIIEHSHSLRGLVPNHEHDGLYGFARTLSDAQKLRDEYDARVAEYRRKLCQ